MKIFVKSVVFVNRNNLRRELNARQVGGARQRLVRLLVEAALAVVRVLLPLVTARPGVVRIPGEHDLVRVRIEELKYDVVNLNVKKMKRLR